MIALLRVLPVALLLSVPCIAWTPKEATPDVPPPWAAPELERAVAVRDGRTGETHIDATTQRVELAVYEGLVTRRAGKLVLAMEIFERDVQDALDTCLAGESTEHEFLASLRPWTNYATGYRPLIEFARARGLPVVASNFPKSLGRKLAMMDAGPDLERLEPEDRGQAPAQLFPGTERSDDPVLASGARRMISRRFTRSCPVSVRRS